MRNAGSISTFPDLIYKGVYEKIVRMAAETSTIDFENMLKFEPVKGCANEYIIRAKKPFRHVRSEEKMSPSDWDKFEKDIAEFKQSP